MKVTLVRNNYIFIYILPTQNNHKQYVHFEEREKKSILIHLSKQQQTNKKKKERKKKHNMIKPLLG